MHPALTTRSARWAARAARVACALLLAAGGAVAGAAPARAQEVPGQPCQAPARPVPRIHEIPWAQRWFAPERVWPITTGDGVTVAVVDSGVDATHPQLSEGAVLAGIDLVRGTAGGNVDCHSHGTAVASLIAASDEIAIGFTGLAPGAKILPVRVTDQDPTSRGAGQDAPVDPATFAAGIRWAVDNGARVINLSIVFHRHHDVVYQAVRYAVDRDVVLVAAVGNRPEGAEAEPDPEPVPYPAAYDGVIGVGAIREDGTLEPTSAVGEFVDLVAPGGGVTAAARSDGHLLWSGTSFAAPFVSAAAALLLSAARGEMSASEVEARLYATADPAGPPDQYGRGIVNPYRALTERLADGDPVAAKPLPGIVTDRLAQARAASWRRAAWLAAAIAATAIGLGGLGALAIQAVARGRRRRWRPARWEPPAPPAAVDDPQRAFFTVPGRHDRA